MYKNLIYILGAIIALLVGYIVYSKLNNTHNHTPHTTEADMQKGESEHAEGDTKEVALNDAQYKNANIELGTFVQKNLSEVINANGYTKLPPQNQADVTAFMSGTIQTIKAVDGQFVKKGQTLATIQSLAYNGLRLEKAKMQEQLDAAQTNKGFLTLEFARQKELSDENVNAKKVFQKVSSDLEFENKKISNLQAQMAIMEQNLQVGGASQSPIVAIVAPISGYVTEVYCKIGSPAEVGKPLFSIVDNSQMHVDLLVYEKDLFKVKVGQTVRFILTNQNNSEVKGKIFSIGKAFENDTKSVAVHADIVNDKQNLISGMYVNALIDIGANSVQSLPTNAIIKADGREFVFVLENEEAVKGEGQEAKGEKQRAKGEGQGEKGEGQGVKEKSYHFQRIEVKTGNTQLGFVQTTFIQTVAADAKIALKGAYYLQSHLMNSEGGGGHEH